MSSVRDVLIKAASEYEAPLVKVCVCVCFRLFSVHRDVFKGRMCWLKWNVYGLKQLPTLFEKVVLQGICNCLTFFLAYFRLVKHYDSSRCMGLSNVGLA